MLNKYLKILLKNRKDRTLPENIMLIHFYSKCLNREFRFAVMVDNLNK